jgi:hypothetical protein
MLYLMLTVKYCWNVEVMTICRLFLLISEKSANSTHEYYQQFFDNQIIIFFLRADYLFNH